MTTKGFRLLLAPEVKEVVSWFDTSTSEVVQVGTVPFIWEVARVVWSEFTFEGPDLVSLIVTVLVVVGETLDTHVSNVLANL